MHITAKIVATKCHIYIDRMLVAPYMFLASTYVQGRPKGHFVLQFVTITTDQICTIPNLTEIKVISFSACNHNVFVSVLANEVASSSE